ncbi:MAG: tRNA (adenosine(37)-N6)-dimethylallyltransferase MiaA [Clostridia bacterium]|nr:tRNA (adenosine(37)-N6)-dimethylallyltransferase MiaA [Clostridia bacterium]
MISAIAITGPTASGKTELSLRLATALGCEIISCDSMQIYRGMDIGTAKATPDEQARVRHHLIDFLSPTESFSVQDYREAAIAAAKEVTSRGKIPLFVGGTGLYIDAIMRADTLTSVPESDRAFRDELLSSVKTEEDKERLWQRLFEVDPDSATTIHKNNLRRVVRALEIFEATGKPKSYFDKLSKTAEGEVDLLMFTLDFQNRDILYRRVDERVDKMIEAGLVEEVRGLAEAALLPNDSTAAQAIGYKEIIEYLDGGSTLDEAIELIKLSSRRYAKRQLTWFRHEKDAVVITVDDGDAMRSKETVLAEMLGVAEAFINKAKNQ